jgi:hypothetical protein
MSILTSIHSFLRHDFGDFFDNFEDFYQNNVLSLVQGILSKKHSSISSIAKDELVDLSHTTLTRFVNGHVEFWSLLDKKIREKTLKSFEDKPMLLVVDDTQLPRRSKKIPFTTKAYDHCSNRFQDAQVLLTIGSVSNGTFSPLEMLFSNVKGKSKEQQVTKNDQLVQWLKDNSKEIKGSTLLGDSWFSHSYVVETAVMRYKMNFIGSVKGSYIFRDRATDIVEKISKYTKELHISEFECFEIDGEKIYVHETIAELHSFRIPMKLVICEDESGRRLALVGTDLNMSAIEIVETYLERWNIETYFKSAKQDFGLGKCKLRTDLGQRNWMILVKLAYLIFKEHMEYLIKAKVEKVSKRYVFMVIRDALSCLSSNLKKTKEHFGMLETDFSMNMVT